MDDAPLGEPVDPQMGPVEPDPVGTDPDAVSPNPTGALERLEHDLGALVHDAEVAFGELKDRILTDAEWLEAWAARPILRGWLHTVAVPLFAGAGVYAVTRAQNPRVRAAAAVYAASVTTMLSVSAAYHRLSKTRRQANVMRRADHAAIFAAVAGTMTPLAVVSLPTPVASGALSGIWAAAAAGMGAKIALLNEERSAGSWGYIALGWLGAGMIVPVTRRAGWATTVEVAAGGIAYTVGAELFRRRWPDPVPGVFGYHEVWHTFVLAGVGLHFDAVRRAINAPEPPPGRAPRIPSGRRVPRWLRRRRAGFGV